VTTANRRAVRTRNHRVHVQLLRLHVGGHGGTQRIQYPANVKLVRLPCTGKTDIRYILKAFEDGADGVYIIACPSATAITCGETSAAAPRPKSQADSQERRAGRRPAGHVFMSGGQGQDFADKALEMTEKVRALGPNPLKT